MAITNGYTTVDNIKAMLSPVGIGTSGSVADDAFIERLIEQASRVVDDATGRQFYTTTETRYHDLPHDETLWLDGDMSSGCVINGDGIGYSGSTLRWYPSNTTPKYAVEFRDSSGIGWTSTAAGDDDEAIRVYGNWGYTVSGSAPPAITRATEEIVKSLYLSRAGQGVDGDATITGAGVVVTPRAIPAVAARIIDQFRRVVLEAG